MPLGIMLIVAVVNASDAGDGIDRCGGDCFLCRGNFYDHGCSLGVCSINVDGGGGSSDYLHLVLTGSPCYLKGSTRTASVIRSLVTTRAIV